MKNLSIYQQLGNKRLEQLDGLRGICALVVAIFHTIEMPYLYGILVGHPEPFYIKIMNAGATVSVMLFFVLSGFVIGYTTPQKYTKDESRKYIWRRLIRLYPVYLIALFLTFYIYHQSTKIWDILGHIFFLQTWLVPLNLDNPSLWSLHYEFIFYLLFLIVWKFNIKTEKAIVVCFICAIISIFVSFHPFTILGYFTVWLSGYWLSQNLDEFDLVSRDYYSYDFWTPIILMVLTCLFFRDTLTRLMANFIILDSHQTTFNYSMAFDFHFPALAFTVFSALALSIVGSLIIKTRIPFYIASLIFIVFVRVSLLVYRLLTDHSHIQSNNFLIYSVLGLVILLPLSFLIKNVPIKFLKKISYFGSFSYALYVIHYPIVFWFNSLSLTNSLLIRPLFLPLIIFVFPLLFSILISWFLECRLQPIISKKLKMYFKV
jgi:peptidoglycan/LPS O-acetylase OafA/YrhL